MTPVLRPAVVGVVASDMAATLTFLRHLGLDVPADADTEPHVEVPLGGLTLAVDTDDTIRSFDPTYVPPVGGGRMGLAFACASPADVDAAFADLVAAGYDAHLPPWDAFWGQRYASVTGPDGLAVDLFAPLPST